MADVTPFHFPGDTITAHATAAVTGGRFVRISGNRVDDNYAVAPAVAGPNVFGVASRDKATGDKVMVFTAGIIEVEAGAALTAGTRVTSDANGAAVAATGAAGATVAFVGIVLADVAAGARGPVLIRPGAFVA